MPRPQYRPARLPGNPVWVVWQRAGRIGWKGDDLLTVSLPCGDGKHEILVRYTRIGSVPVKLVIFDFDGTLVDSRKLIVELNRIVFGEFGFALPSEDESFALVGMSLELVLPAIGGAGRAGCGDARGLSSVSCRCSVPTRPTRKSPSGVRPSCWLRSPNTTTCVSGSPPGTYPMR